MQTRLMHKSQRSVICGFIFLIWASGKFMFWRGYICRTSISRRARMLFWAYRKLKPHLYYRKNGSGPIKKLVWTRYFCCMRKPSVPCFHEMDPDSLFSSFGAIATPKKKQQLRTPFAVRKHCVNASSFSTIFFM